MTANAPSTSAGQSPFYGPTHSTKISNGALSAATNGCNVGGNNYSYDVTDVSVSSNVVEQASSPTHGAIAS